MKQLYEHLLSTQLSLSQWTILANKRMKTKIDTNATLMKMTVVARRFPFGGWSKLGSTPSGGLSAGPYRSYSCRAVIEENDGAIFLYVDR